MSENKRQKQHEIERTDNMIDCISNLPDCVLHHILSFLPTIEVVETSILSKRWKNLWASVPSLKLDDSIIYASTPELGFDRSPESIASFVNFEERILLSPGALKIENFHLSCEECFNPSRVSSWIANAVMHNVREVVLCLYANNRSTISQSLFDCKSLVILNLEILADIQIPSRIYLPCLKILSISLVCFMNADVTENLFSSCLVLEELVLGDCVYGHYNNITISSLTLKKLTIKDHMDTYRTPPNGCKIKINAKDLTYFNYDGSLSNEIFLDNVPSLVKACIRISLVKAFIRIPPVDTRQKEVEVAYRAIDQLKWLQNVVSLSVSNCTLESIICADTMNLFPVFPNLTHLVVTTEIDDYTFRTFMYLLNFCPALQSIDLSKGFSSRVLLGENDLIWLLVPTCISYHLKTISFKNFHANDSEIWFLKFVLKFVRVLEKMNVWWCKTELVDLKKQRDVRKELITTEKSSASVGIKLSMK